MNNSHQTLEIKNKLVAGNGIKNKGVRERLLGPKGTKVIIGVLRGKNKPTYNPHIDNGDFVVVTNIEKMKFTGKKLTDKKYYRHTGHPGGIKYSTHIGLKKKNKTNEI